MRKDVRKQKTIIKPYLLLFILLLAIYISAIWATNATLNTLLPGQQQTQPQLQPQKPTEGTCLVIDVCDNGVDEDCSGNADDNCFALNSRVTHWPMGLNIDTAYFGACHDTTLTPRGPCLMPEDNNFGENNGQLSFTHWGNEVETSFAIGTGDLIEFDLAVEPGYNILSIDTFEQQGTTEGSYTTDYSFDNWQTTQQLNMDDGKIYMNGYLIEAPQGVSTVRVRIIGVGNTMYFRGARTTRVRRNYVQPTTLGPAQKPNLHFTDFTPIREKIENTPVLEGYKNRITAGWGSANLNYAPPTEYGGWNLASRSYSQDLNMLALACLQTEQQEYCDKAREVLLAFSSWEDDASLGEAGWGRFEQGTPEDVFGGLPSILGNGEMIYGMALAFDLVYDSLTEQEREIVAQRIDYETNYLYQRSRLGNSWTGETWWNFAPATNNWGGIAGSALGMAGLVLQDYSPYADTYLDRGVEISKMWINKLSEYIPYEGAPEATENEGVIFESVGYQGYPSKYVLGMFDALNRKKGVNLFDYGGGKLNNAMNYMVYSLTPQGIGYSHFDDYYASPDNGGDPITTAWLMMSAKIFDNGLALDHWDRRSGSRKKVEWTWTTGGSALDLQYTLLFYPENLEMETPEDRNLPLGKLFQYGKVISRTGWDENDAYLQLNSGLYGSHAHRDQGSFFYGDHGNMLITERGGGESDFHNLVLIDGVGQGTMQWYDSGGVTGMLSSEVIDFIHTDTKVAYDTQVDVEYAKRDIIFRRGNDKYLVLFDKLRAQDGLTHTYSSQLFQEEYHEQTQTISQDHYRFLGNDQVLHDGNILTGRTADIDLDVYIAAPTNYQTDNSAIPFAIETTNTQGHFAILLYPGQNSQTVNQINNEGEGINGFSVGNDLILQTEGTSFVYENNGKNVDSDGEIIFVNDNVVSYKGGTHASYEGLGISSNTKTNALLERKTDSYTIVIGDQNPEFQTPTTITLQGITPGTYALEKDGTQQANVEITDDGIDLTITETGQHTITLNPTDGTVIEQGIDDPPPPPGTSGSPGGGSSSSSSSSSSGTGSTSSSTSSGSTSSGGAEQTQQETTNEPGTTTETNTPETQNPEKTRGAISLIVWLTALIILTTITILLVKMTIKKTRRTEKNTQPQQPLTAYQQIMQQANN